MGKYQARGMVTAVSGFGMLKLPTEMKERLVEISNYGLAKATWSNYKTAETMLLRCQAATGRNLELPLDAEKVLVFVDWLIQVRKVKYRTIENYLAGLRQLHIVLGMETPNLRNGLVNLVLTGRRNMEVREKKVGAAGSRRLPVTLNVMKLIKAAVKEADWGKGKKLLHWAVCCLAFNGSFRISEILATETGRFDPASTLLEEDLALAGQEGEQVIQVRVKWAKQDRAGEGFTVEVFETRTDTCPVKALKKWWSSGPPRDKGMPAFRKDDGMSFTGKDFNRELRELLGGHINYQEGGITSHSFRGGVPSIMGSLGYTDEEIKKVGNWSSRAFEHYTKLPRTNRRQMALNIKNL
jgi:hypothetical protein